MIKYFDKIFKIIVNVKGVKFKKIYLVKQYIKHILMLVYKSVRYKSMWFEI
jgi:hypothetical protein